MIRKFFLLEWKQFWRSSNLTRSVGVKILLSFLAFFYGVWFLMLSFQLYGLLKNKFPELDPLVVANSFVFYWLFFDLTIRHFFQKIPSFGIASLLTLNIKKNKIIHYILGRTTISFLNFITALASVPFAISLLMKGYTEAQVFAWLIFLMFATMAVNFIHVLITSKDGMGKDYIGFVITGLFAVIIFLDYLEIFSLRIYFGQGVDYLIANPYLLLFPFLIVVGFYIWAFRTLKKHFYLDAVLQIKHKNRKSNQLGWVERFGEIAPLLKLDMRLARRSKRVRGLLMMATLLLFYGLLFYRKGEPPTPFMMMLLGVFITGAFIYNFGMYIPAWDGSYYRFLMAQNITANTYLREKYFLLSSVSFVAFLLSIPYAYFGWEIVFVNFSAFMFNIGVLLPFLLYYGSFSRKAMDLKSSGSFNYQGVSGKDMLMFVPILLLPCGAFALLSSLTNLPTATGIYISLGFFAFLFRSRILGKIAKRYDKNKYKMILAFYQK